MAITVIAIWGRCFIKKINYGITRRILVEYMNHIEKKEYEVMYTMIDSDEKVYLTKRRIHTTKF